MCPYEDRRGAGLDPRLVGCIAVVVKRSRGSPPAGSGDLRNGWFPWAAERALQRYGILYEAGRIPESDAARPLPSDVVGSRMLHGHRRILATGLARLRATIQYRPVVFEPMPAVSTLGQLRECVESSAGQRVHK